MFPVESDPSGFHNGAFEWGEGKRMTSTDTIAILGKKTPKTAGVKKTQNFPALWPCKPDAGFTANWAAIGF